MEEEFVIVLKALPIKAASYRLHFKRVNRCSSYYITVFLDH